MRNEEHLFYVCLLLITTGFPPATAADWPMQRKDAARSRVTDETLMFPMHCVWRYLPAQPPQPAWPEPPRLPNRMDFDYASVPVIAGGTLYFGSSADDTVRALDGVTGALKWQFTAGGPIRFAPQIENGKVYFASDDGLVYCLAAGTGKMVWKFQAAPCDEQMIGNRRMISRWPIRTGVLVQDGVVYAVAGIWPSEGIYVYALKADTGEVVWLNDRDSFGRGMIAGAGGDSRWNVYNDPHMGEFATGGLTPQGALLATQKTLLVPLAHNAAAQFNLKSGYLNVFYDVATGSSTPFLDGVMFYTFLSSMGTTDTLFGGVIKDEGARSWAVQYSGTNLLPAAAAGDARVVQGKVDAIVSDGERYVRRAGGLALTANALLVGRRDEIVAEDRGTAQTLWRAPVRGLAREIAVADGRVYVATDTGEISCFAPARSADKAVGKPQSQDMAAATVVHDARAAVQARNPTKFSAKASAVVAELKRRHADRGVALVLADEEGVLSRVLAAQTSLHVLNVSTNANEVAALRARLVRETAWYGSRIHVIHVPDLRRLPFAQYFANAVIVATDKDGRDPDSKRSGRPSTTGIGAGGPRSVVADRGGPGAPPRRQSSDGQVALWPPTGRTASESGLSGSELYRVLHPCGGVLLCPGLENADAETLIRECDAYEAASHAQSLQGTTEPTPVPIAKGIGTTPPLEEIIRSGPLLGGVPGGRGGSSFFVRGALPGARDWNTQPPSDQRVKWPLRPLWFGGPEAAQVMNIGLGAHPPMAANGRYFVTGEDCLTAVDAYNGMTLWSRLIPPAAPRFYQTKHALYVDQWEPIKRFIAADDRHVYLRLGAGWFQGKGEALIRLDAYSGAQKGLYAPYLAPTNVVMTAPQQWAVAWDETHVGKVTLAQQAEGIVLTFASLEPMAQALRWEVCMDFRETERRYGLYEDGAFALELTPSATNGAPASAHPVSGQRFPEYTVRGGSRQGVSELVLTLPWRALDQFVGRRPVSFDLAVGGVWLAGVPAAQPRYLFGDGVARYLNRGWARVLLGGAPTPNKPPAILAGEISQRPANWQFPDVYQGELLQHPGELSPATRTATRLHPLTGEPGLRVYRSGTGGCGLPVYSANSAIGRTSKIALGFYDFADDSGLRMFPGIGANCGAGMKAQNMTAALGLLIFSDSRSHCTCMIPIRTSLAFAPAERRLQEDWAIFCDRNADAPVRRVAINLGAPGDRRDEQGTLWLGFPRQADGKAYPREPGSARFVIQSPPIASSIYVPLKVNGLAGFTKYERLNADSTRIEGTDRPWLYTSCLRGVTNLTLTLEPQPSLLATAAQTQPVLDGRLETSFWNTNNFTRVLSFTGTRMALRFDEKHLYIGAYRLPLVDARGQAAAWTSATQGEDAPIYQDDSMEFFLSDKANTAVVHLGVSASGARYDALAQGREPERAAWNGEWWSKVRADDTEFAVELAIPWTTLKAAGLDTSSLALNMQVNQKNIGAEVPFWPGAERVAPARPEGIGDSMLSLGPQGRARCANFTPVGLGQAAVRKPRLFTVRLHFADLREKADVRRVFDVLLQGKTVLNNFNIVQEALASPTPTAMSRPMAEAKPGGGGTHKAIVKEFQHVSATDTLTLEFQMPADVNPDRGTVPLLSALEVLDEAFAASLPRPETTRQASRVQP